ncbi:hypothetical protein Pcinc_015547 [Petrolisthes cinctipes]|uniref:FAD-binding FR-type domain-containing protein n=1 Tax=Petrolisthes cinctipes TaxID=88211 RepID=A0AAE1FY23_PETCI|nr:hypothetical protein Pcinc_015547 [Petrolisthes cinctipes]
MKKWGRGEFWGLSSDFDHDFALTDTQKKLLDDVRELCRVKIKPLAIKTDRDYVYPRESMNALAEMGLLGLIIPKELGGLGESHVFCSMFVETLARYGCPSTAMIYTMHVSCLATILFRYHNNPLLKELLTRIDKDKLIGTLSYSDPATGGHFWFPLSSKVKELDENTVKLLKYGSWATSAGYADFYVIQTLSPSHAPGDYSDLSCFLVYKDEIRANTDDWEALGMHGNMSGPLVIEGIFKKERMVGSPGDGRLSNDECVDPYFLLNSAACWNGISLACMDLAKKHVTRKAHADVGMRVCDYPTIQDYFGEGVCDVNASRALVLMVAKELDLLSKNNDWTLFADLTFAPRMSLLHWLWQVKFVAAKVVYQITDKMLQACGGSGYKTDLGLERLLRDGKASWVMGPSNEVLRQFVGKTCLFGLESIDYWAQHLNDRVIHNELKKMNVEQKKELAQRLLKEVDMEEKGIDSKHPYQETDFENPFNTCPPAVNDKVIKTSDGLYHSPALKPDTWTSLKLKSYRDVSNKMGSFVFTLPNSTDHAGCFAGQYMSVRANIKGKEHTRYFSPVSHTSDYGKIELVMRFEKQGIMSNYFKNLKPGQAVDFQGPCGGFEYQAGALEHLTLLASGGGITPNMQLVREVMANPNDQTHITLLYFSENCNEILFKEELDKYEDKRLNIIHTLGEAPDNWEGEEGFIDTHMIDQYVPKPNGINHKIVMCGGPQMILSCLYSLHSLGFPSESIFVYGQFGTEQVKTVYGRKVALASHHCDKVL